MKIKYIVVIKQILARGQMMITKEVFDTESDAERYASINRLYPHEGKIVKQIITQEVVKEWTKTK